MAAWLANSPSRSRSAGVIRRGGRVEHLNHAHRLLTVHQRRRHDRAGDIAGTLGDVPGKPRVGLGVLDHDRLAGDQHPAGQPAAGREAGAHQRLLAVAGDGREDQLVGLLVEHEDRGGRGTEDAAGDDHGQQQLAVRLLTRQRPAASAARDSPLIGPRPRPRCSPSAQAPSSSAQVSATVRRADQRDDAGDVGAAKLLPVAVILPPPNQATSTPIPRAKNSTGGAGLTK